ncbi:MAG: alpha-L-fucosidase [Reichenbachiella sp.]
MKENLMKKYTVLNLILIILLVGCQEAKKEEVFKPNWESLAKQNKEPDWFADAKLGIYFHWGVYSVPAFGSEWYPRWMYSPDRESWGKGTFQYHEKTFGHPSEFNYHDFVPMFKASQYDPKEWAELFKSSGAKFAGPVALHHDGFAMWDSEVNPWNAMDKGPKRDILGDLFVELKKNDLKTIATFHHARTLQRNAKDSSNWEGSSSHFPYHPDYATSSTDAELKYLYGNIPAEEFHDYWLNEVKEVVDKYAPDIIWFDSWLDKIPEDYLQRMVAYQANAGEKKNQETLVVYKNKDLPREVAVLDIEQGGMKEMSPDYWMTDITISNNSWSYVQNQTYKKSSLIIKNMIDVWSKKGVVLLNISPTADGVIPDEQRAVLGDLGSWLSKNGEAIYGTRTHSIYGYGKADIKDGSHGGQSATIKYSAEDIRFTKSKDGKNIYVFCLGQPKQGEKIGIKYLEGNGESLVINKVSLLGRDVKLDWEMKDSVLNILAPDVGYTDEIATIFKVELE